MNDSSEPSSSAEPGKGIVAHNVRELHEHRQEHKKRLTPSERISSLIANYCGTSQFVALNAIFFAVWVVANVGWLGVKPFDPFPFELLTTIVSLEAIFLSLFVLLSQTRMQKLNDQQSELDLQVNLLTERELTHVLRTVDAIAVALKVPVPEDPSKEEMVATTRPDQVMAEIEKLDDCDEKGAEVEREA